MAGHKFAVAAAMMFLGGCATHSVGTAQAAHGCDGSPASNRRVVLAFYTEGLIGRQPRYAFERYMAPGFVEHKPDVPQGTREAAATFLEELIAEVPQPRWDVLRTIAEGDLVFLHARFTPAEGAPAYAIADIFRLKECKIVEHWDVVAPPPKDQRNSNPRF
ncbi:nuclear transport factor 2 family protein [Sandarakinorhabdus sp.]|uniref:nuclear transport factor 2 family protein n=1 Tax=Sandarakinorhabdus sp. TaxID=1916663 RepID=UPI00286E79B3|nr:nuclear transport factor 2 family protein [Sandarakinorhabdus sp.]